MTQKTFILGKDAALEDSITQFRQRLLQFGFHIEEASWLNPVPHVWSVHIRDKDCPQCFSNGKGASQKAALASALGEFFERLSTNYFFADYYLGADIAHSAFVHYPQEKWFPIKNDNSLPEGLLDDTWQQFLAHSTPLTPDLFVDLQSGNPQRGIVALPYERQSDGQTVYIPQSLIGNLFVSNGMSAGNSRYEARVQALSEIFERYIKHKIIAKAISLPEIPADIMAHYPQIQLAINTMEQAGFPILAYDASLGGQYPVICVVLLNPHNGTCFASFGSHPKFEVAFERTITELLQGRSLKDLDVFASPSFDNEEVADPANLETHFIDSSGLVSWDLFKQPTHYSFVHWNFSADDTQHEYQNLIDLFHQHQHEVYIMDYLHLGVPSCRILVPHLSNIYPADDLIYANNNMGMSWRNTLLALPLFQQTPECYSKLLSELDEQGIDDAIRIREFIGIVPPANTGWTTWRIGELKSMLFLALGQWEEALIWANWTLDMNESLFSQKRSNYYRCLISSLELHLDEKRKPSEYRIAFEKLYGQDTVEFAWQAIKGGNPFYDLTASDERLNQFKEHQQLLTAYQKLQQAKQLN